MKQKKVMALLLTMGMVMTGCGTMVESGVAETLREALVIQEDEGVGENFGAEGDNASDMVEIISETCEDEVTEDGTTICGYVGEFPMISIKGNESATKAIQKDVEERKKNFISASESMQKQAHAMYKEAVEAGEGEYFQSHGNYGSYTIMKNDGEILSLVFNYWSYAGGAHGNAVETTANYDLKTGERLTFENCFKEPESAVASIKEHILRQCESPYYQDRLSPEYKTYIDDIISEDYWYFAKDGMHMIANESAIAAYAVGKQDFVIPYTEVPEMKKEYVKTATFLYPSIQGQTVQMDLDADGVNESICYDLIEEEGETYIDGDGIEYQMGFQVHPSIVIDGEEFAELLISQQDYWTESLASYCYFVDLDKNDSYIELAIVDYGVNDNPHTYFFRYDKGELKYLGSITDTVDSDTCELLGDGTLKARVHSNLLETIRLDSKFEFQGEKLRETDIEWYDMNQNGEKRTHNILKEVIVFTEKSTDSATKVLTKAEGPVLFVATDNKEWVKIQAGNGDVYYLHMTGFTEIHSGDTTEDAMDVFADLLIAG